MIETAASAVEGAARPSAVLDEAVARFRKAAKVAPRDAEAWRNLGSALGWLGRLKEGEKALRRALALAPADPTTRFFLGTCLLGQGRYAEGWRGYEARFDVPQLNLAVPRDLPMPRWAGEPIEGKRILVFHEQGYGDQMQFARFLPRLVAMGAKVAVRVGPPLERLFRHSFPNVFVVPDAEGAPQLPMTDYWTTLVSLARHSGATLETLPTAPYLTSPVTWETPPVGWKTGLMVQGGAAYVNDRQRSLPPALAAELKRSLPGRVIDLDPANTRVGDFAETASIIRELDLVVSVDTSVAHLAGAMGKRCLVLIPGIQTDWRWMYDRRDSPWYPHHRLYRNPIDGDWREPVAAIVRDAHALAAGGGLP